MKKGIFLFCIVLAAGIGVEGALAASGKCTVVKIEGVQMVIECNEQTKGFSKGNQIKIKSDKKKTDQNK